MKDEPVESMFTENTPSIPPLLRKDEYMMFEPSFRSWVTKRSPPPLCISSSAPGVVGKSVEEVDPLMTMFPVRSKLMIP